MSRDLEVDVLCWGAVSPSLEGCEQVVIGPEVIEGKAKPLYIYSDKGIEAASSA